MELQGRSIWLIGASSGIGAALAPKLVAQGARLVISARREAELAKVAESCAPHSVLIKRLDVTDTPAVEAVYREVVAAQGPLDAMIFSAGAWEQGGVEDFDVEAAVGQVSVNYLGLMRVTGIVMPDMIARRAGSIIGMASIAGYGGLPRAAAYSSSKAGVLAFLQATRIELKRHNVEVVTISPGFVRTPLTEKNDFTMPFMIEAEDAANRIIEGLQNGAEEIHFPRRLSIPVKLLTALPRPAYEFLIGKLMVRGART